MATTIVTKKGSGAPAASDLVEGELAVDTTNGRLYTENSSAAVVELGSNPSGNITFGDNGKAIFGAGSDLQIYHTGTESIIKDSGTGDLNIEASDDIRLRQVGGAQNYIYCHDGGEVILYNAGNAKLATTATGIDVTGSVTADGLTVDGNGDVQLNRDGASSAKIFWDRSGTTDAKIELEASENLVMSVDDAGLSGKSLILKNNNKQGFALSDGGDISFYEDTGTTAKLHWDASAESLGIGTSSPATLVDLKDTTPTLRLTDNRDITWSGNETLGNIEFFTSDSSGSGAHVTGFVKNIQDRTGGSSQVTGALSFGVADYGVAAVEALRIDSQGRVGIGTDSPAGVMHLRDTVPHLYLQSDDAQSSKLLFGDASDNSRGGFEYTSSDELKFMTNNLSEKMRIDSSGNVLVGKTASSFTTAGVELAQGGAAGKVQIQRSSGPLALVNLTDDGSILNFYKGTSAVGSIGTNGGIPYFLRTSGGIAIGNAGLYSAAASGAANDATSDLGGATFRWKDLYLSGGVYLGGTAAANKLEDYESGTWTPSLVGNTTGGSHTYGYQNGKYTKVGNTVTASFGMYITTKDNTMNGNALVSGLPVSASMGTNVFANLAIGWAANITYGDMLGGYINSGTSIALRLNNSASASGFLQSSAIGSGSVYLFGTITYQV